MLAKKYEPNIDVVGWYITEKLDGVRSFWKDGKLFTRNGKVINTPKWFIKNFPDIDLDGELWIDRGKFNEVSGIVRKKVPKDEEWSVVKYVVFDLPSINKMYEDRVDMYKKILTDIECDWLIPLKVEKLVKVSDLFKKLSDIEKIGGEGLMLRRPGSMYENKRSSSLLKVKSFHDDEGVVIGYNGGTGKYKDTIGSLIINNNNITFSVGSGLTVEDRHNPPKIGSVITYKYFEKNKGIPRFPIYVGVRDDI